MDCSEESSFNKRQFNLMLDRITSFLESRSISFEKLIADLEGLIEILEIPEDERDRLRTKWGVLEDVYAEALFSGIRRLEEDDVARVEQALQDLKELIKGLLMQCH